MAGIIRVLGMVAACAALANACGSQGTPGPAPNNATTHYDPETRRLERVTYDRNNDGRVDATTFMDGAKVTRAELDENFDGVIDRREYFVSRPADAGSAASMQLDRVEASTRADGRTTRWERYEDGQLRHVEEDTDEDGRVDKWETWTAGSLSMVAMDTRGSGHPDRRLVYPAGGGEPQLEMDPDPAAAGGRSDPAHP